MKFSRDNLRALVASQKDLGNSQLTEMNEHFYLFSRRGKRMFYEILLFRSPVAFIEKLLIVDVV